MPGGIAVFSVLAPGHARFLQARVAFEAPPRDEPCGRVAVFRDSWGNRRDLIRFADPASRCGTG
ncbi:hypothetical protein MASR1M32_19250 [Rhodobacter sp.]